MPIAQFHSPAWSFYCFIFHWILQLIACLPFLALVGCHGDELTSILWLRRLGGQGIIPHSSAIFHLMQRVSKPTKMMQKVAFMLFKVIYTIIKQIPLKKFHCACNRTALQEPNLPTRKSIDVKIPYLGARHLHINTFSAHSAVTNLHL